MCREVKLRNHYWLQIQSAIKNGCTFLLLKKKVRCITIKNIYFEDIEELVCDMADSYDSVKDNEDKNDVAVIAKYAEMREIIKELSCIGYTIHSCQLEDEEWDGYDAEFICTIYDSELWIEKMLKDSGYITDESAVIYLLGNCSSKIISNVKSKNIYEVSLNDDDEGNCTDCKCKSDCKEYSGTDEDGNDFYITIEGDLDLDEAYAKLDEMESRMVHMSEMFDEMNNFSRLLGFRI